MVVSENCIETDKIWLLFFNMMFSFYTVTIVQYLAYAVIVAFIVWKFAENGYQIYAFEFKKILLICSGYALLVLLAFLSRTWNDTVVEGSKLFLNMVKILVVMLCVVFYSKSIEKVKSVLLAYTQALAVMCILILTTTPLSTYGTTQFWGIPNQHRNTVANATFFAILIVWYLAPYISSKMAKAMVAIFLVTGLCTGSRRGIIQLVLMAILFTLTQKGIRKRIRLMMAGFFVGAVFLMVITSVPQLNENYWPRFLGMFTTSIDDTVGEEKSAVGRNIYRSIGWQIAKERPWLGYGVDGFYGHLKGREYTYTTYRLEAVHSHCNYIEVLVNYGILGSLFYYFLPVYLIIKAWRRYKEERFSRMIVIIMMSTLVLDYGGVSYHQMFAIYLYAIFATGIYEQERTKEFESDDEYLLRKKGEAL